MIIGAEVALLLIGLYALITGSLLNRGGKYVVQGWPARLIGVIGFLPIPLSLAVSTAVAALLIAQGRQVTPLSFYWVATAIEGSTVVVCILAIVVLSRVCRMPVEAAQLSNSFGAALPTVLEAIDGALRDLGAKSVKWSSDRRRVSARIGFSFWSLGERLTVEVEESGDVRVASVCSTSWGMIDWGKNARNRRKFLETLASRLESGVRA